MENFLYFSYVPKEVSLFLELDYFVIAVTFVLRF
jgi:hypothetical protein